MNLKKYGEKIMEKISRKVSCKDRLPSKCGYYYTGKDILYYYKFNNSFCRHPNGTKKRYTKPEYWYEEVDLKQAFEEAFKIEFIDNAKERYEKALNKLNLLLNQSFECWSEDAIKGYKTLAATVEHSILPIAAGLEKQTMKKVYREIKPENTKGYYNYTRLPRKLKKRIKKVCGIHYQKDINASLWYYLGIVNPKHINNLISKIVTNTL